jgi:hypothetical protein
MHALVASTPRCLLNLLSEIISGAHLLAEQTAAAATEYVVVTLFSALDVSATPDATSAMTRKVIPSGPLELPNERLGKVENERERDMSKSRSIQNKIL